MSYLEKDQGGLIKISDKVRTDFLSEVFLEKKDSTILMLLIELNFDPGRTRWDNPIIWTHLPSRRIRVTIHLPPLCSFWDRTPHVKSNPNNILAFICSCDYEIEVFNRDGCVEEIKAHLKVSYINEAEHWLDLPMRIREAWEWAGWKR